MLTTSEIKQFIEEDISSEKKRLAGEGQRYYEGKHDILNRRLFYYNSDGKLVEDKTRANIKICHPFFTELNDQLTSYILSFKDNPVRALKPETGLQEHLDLYFNRKFWAEMADVISGAYSKGFDYMYAYQSDNNRLAFEFADAMGVVEVDKKYSSDKQNHILYHYVDKFDKDKKPIIKIQDWTETETYHYVQHDRSGKIELDKDIEINPRPHVVYTEPKTGKKMGYPFGFIPFFRLDYNRKQISGLMPIKALIDDYDLMMCSLSNNLADFDTPLYVVSGFQGDNLDQLQQNLKTKKIVGTDGEGGVEVKTVDIPYQARQTKAHEDKEAIYQCGMALDISTLTGTATTNMLILAAHSRLKMKADKLIIRLEAMLEEMLKPVIAEINKQNGTGYTLADVEIKFEPVTITNEAENVANEKIKAETKQIEVNTVLNIAAEVGEEQTLKAICEVMDFDFEELKGELEKQTIPSIEDARDDLDNIDIIEE